MPDDKNGQDLRARGLSMFFPAYNEEENVARTIAQATEVCQGLGLAYEIIIVDDGSADRTAEIVESLGRTDEHIVLIRHGRNRGYGQALQTGLAGARYGLIFFSDCDLQFDLGELPELLGRMEQDPAIDMVIGYRIRRADPFMRKINAFGWKLWSRLVFGLAVRDVDCAFKLFKREAVAHLTLESTGALISVEMLTRIQRKGFRLAQHGVHHYPRQAGKQTGAKLSVILRAFRESLALYRSLGQEQSSGTKKSAP